MKPVFATYYRTVRSDQYLKIKYVWPIKINFGLIRAPLSLALIFIFEPIPNDTRTKRTIRKTLLQSRMSCFSLACTRTVHILIYSTHLLLKHGVPVAISCGK